MGYTVTFGEALRKRREEAGLSLRKFSRLVCYSPGWMSRIENDLAAPTLQMARLCDDQLSANGELMARAQHTRVDVIPPVQVPRTVERLIGRERELRFLDTCLESPAGMAVSIEGAAGVGKTALAVTWAHRAAGSFQEGVLYADLQGHSTHAEPVAPEQVLDDFLVAMGVGPHAMPSTLSQRTALLRSLTARRHVLMVLDDAADFRQVEPLLPGCPNCAVVITSRRRLVGLMVHDLAVPLPLEPLAQDDAVRVLRLVAADACGEAPAITQQLARQCGRVPLALRMAGLRLSTYRGTHNLVQDFTDPSTLLDLLSDAEDNTLSVRAALERSYRDLDEDAARLFRLLGRDPHGLTAIEVSVLSGWPPARSDLALDRLIDVHLVNYDSCGLYVLNELNAVFAAEKAAHGEAALDSLAAMERLTAWWTERSPAIEALSDQEHRV